MLFELLVWLVVWYLVASTSPEKYADEIEQDWSWCPDGKHYMDQKFPCDEKYVKYYENDS